MPGIATIKIERITQLPSGICNAMMSVVAIAQATTRRPMGGTP